MSLRAPQADLVQPEPAEVLDVAACAALFSTTQKAIRARVNRQQLPFRRWGGRIIFLRRELLVFLDTLPGTRADETRIPTQVGH